MPWRWPGATWRCTARTPGHDLTSGGSRVHFSTAGAAVMVADPENNSYRESTAQDLYDMARIADTCEHIHMFQRTCVLRDIPDNYEMDLNTAYCVVMGTRKQCRLKLDRSHPPGKDPGNAARHGRRVRPRGGPGRLSASPTVSWCRP